jgi:hypothetical protein
MAHIPNIIKIPVQYYILLDFISLPAISPLQLLAGSAVSLSGYFAKNRLPVKETQHLTSFSF